MSFDPKMIRAWGTIVVSVFSLTILAVLTFFAFHTNDLPLEQLVAGAVIGYASASVQYFIGSSASSQSKDEIIAASNPPPAPPVSAPPVSAPPA